MASGRFLNSCRTTALALSCCNRRSHAAVRCPPSFVVNPEVQPHLSNHGAGHTLLWIRSHNSATTSSATGCQSLDAGRFYKAKWGWRGIGSRTEPRLSWRVADINWHENRKEDRNFPFFRFLATFQKKNGLVPQGRTANKVKQAQPSGFGGKKWSQEIQIQFNLCDGSGTAALGRFLALLRVLFPLVWL